MPEPYPYPPYGYPNDTDFYPRTDKLHEFSDMIEKYLAQGMKQLVEMAEKEAMVTTVFEFNKV